MSTHAKALARSVAGLLGCLVATGAWAQQAEMEVSQGRHQGRRGNAASR